MKPIYSICISNYNMSSTVASLNSILYQLDDSFEVVVADDGSSDNSLKFFTKSRKNILLRIIPLVRDNRRKLGETRNVSVRASSVNIIAFRY